MRWGTSLADDLARRDFTVNAIAWRPAQPDRGRRTRWSTRTTESATWRRGVLRAVGDPAERFAEDALRMVRAVRFATRLGLLLDPATEAAIAAHAADVASLSGERVRDELLRMLGGSPPAAPPSTALALMERLGLLAVLLPELAALRGVPQAKAAARRRAGPLAAHRRRPARRRAARCAWQACCTTSARQRPWPTATSSVTIARAPGWRRTSCGGCACPARTPRWIVRLVRQHMFAYTPDWTDAAVRRFVAARGSGPA